MKDMWVYVYVHRYVYTYIYTYMPILYLYCVSTKYGGNIGVGARALYLIFREGGPLCLSLFGSETNSFLFIVHPRLFESYFLLIFASKHAIDLTDF